MSGSFPSENILLKKKNLLEPTIQMNKMFPFTNQPGAWGDFSYTSPPFPPNKKNAFCRRFFSARSHKWQKEQRAPFLPRKSWSYKAILDGY